MAILIKCNESALSGSDEQNFTLRKEKGVNLVQGLEAFVWVSESPREGPPSEPGGLRLRGQVSNWVPADRGTVTISFRMTERLRNAVGMNSVVGVIPEEARSLRRRIQGFRHPRIWRLSPVEREALCRIFDSQNN